MVPMFSWARRPTHDEPVHSRPVICDSYGWSSGGVEAFYRSFRLSIVLKQKMFRTMIAAQNTIINTQPRNVILC